MNIFKKIFKWGSKTKEKSPPVSVLAQVNLANIKQFDDVWVKENDLIFEGWVVKKEGGVLFIVYTDNNKKLQDALFKIERPLDRTQIEDNGKILYLNNYSSLHNWLIDTLIVIDICQLILIKVLILNIGTLYTYLEYYNHSI